MIEARGSRPQGETPPSNAPQYRDDIAALSLTDAESFGWRRFLSSLCSVEGTERILLSPLKTAYEREGFVTSWMETHLSDEKLHFDLFSDYLKRVFNFEKNAPTFSDRIFYDTLLPVVARSFETKPLYGLVLIYTYERLSIPFYKRTRELAEARGFQELPALFRFIERDEADHMRAMAELIRWELKRTRWTLVDEWKMRGILAILSADISMAAWAVHNREVQHALRAIGIEPTWFNASVREACRKSLEFVRENSQP